MNIQALNAGSTISRPRVPRNNDVAFGKAHKAKATKNTAKNNAKNTVKKGFRATVAEKFSSIRKGAGTAFEKAHKNVSEFIAKNRGTKLVGIAAMGITVLIAGALAIKEIHDIITKSNPEN